MNEIDPDRRPVILAHRMNVVGGTASDVLGQRLGREGAHPHALLVQLLPDVALEAVRNQHLLRIVVGLRHEEPVIRIDGPLLLDVVERVKRGHDIEERNFPYPPWTIERHAMRDARTAVVATDIE